MDAPTEDRSRLSRFGEADRRWQARELLDQLDRLKEKRDATSISAPIAIVSLGGAATLIGIAVAATANTGIGEDNTRQEIIGWSVAGVGAALSITGLVVLFDSLEERRKYDRPIRRLERELRVLQYSAGVGPGYAAFRLSYRF